MRIVASFRNGRWPRCLAALLALGGVLLLAALVRYVLTHYFVKPYSDPLNWLSYARHLKESYLSSHWPIGFPLFLWLAERLAGPYYVFLANLPVLVLLAAAVGLLAALAVRADDGPARPWPAALAGLSATALWVRFDPDLLVYLTNPYRDPLSFLLLTAACIALAVYLGSARHRLGWLAGAGLLLGLAYTTRETSILVLPWFFTGALWCYWRDRRIGFWRSVAVFVPALAVACLPVVLQSFLQTGQALAPTQAVGEGGAVSIPGLHTETHGKTLHDIADYLREREPWLHLPLLAAGLAAAAWRRQRLVLGVLAPALLTYVAFYSYYEYFVRRYFLVTVLFVAPVAAYGLYALSGWITAAARRWWRVPAGLVHGLAVAALCLGTALSLLRAEPTAAGHFRIRDAIRLDADLAPRVPAGAVVLCGRHLSEVIRYLRPVDAFPCYEICRNDVLSADDIHAQVGAFRAGNRPVFLVSPHGPGRPDSDATALLRSFDLEPVWTLDAGRYHLGDVYGHESATLFRVQPWTQTNVSVRLPPAVPPFVLRVDGRDLWRRDPARTTAQLWLDGRLLDERVADGANYYPVAEPPAPGLLRLVSDRPLPADPDPACLPAAAPLTLDFGEDASPSHAGLLSPEFFEVNPSLCSSVVALTNRGTLTLPMPWPDTNAFVFAGLVVSAAFPGDAEHIRLDVAAPDGTLLRAYDLPHDTRGYTFAVPLPAGRPGEPLPIGITVRPLRTGPLSDKLARELGANHPDDPRYQAVNFDACTLYRVPDGADACIAIGGEGDVPFVWSGFYRPEVNEQRLPVRWTEADACIAFPLRSAGDAGLDIELRFFAHHRPAAAPPLDLAAAVNDAPLALQPLPALPELPQAVRLAGTVPAASLRAGLNTLRLTCRPWVPADYMDTRDRRPLGLMLHQVRLQRHRP